MAMAKNVNIAVIGTGRRAMNIINHLLNFSERNVCVSAVYEPEPENARMALEKWKSPGAKVCSRPEEAISSPEVDVVMIFTPNYLHKQYILDSLAAGKNVFSEKPLATTISDCQEVLEAQHKSKNWLMTGFVLRYSLAYRKIKELLDSGKFGRIISISATENRATTGGGSSMNNWRRFTKQSGPYILEKCSHDMDLLNWFTGSLPTRVAGFGGLDYFVPENKGIWEKYGKGTFTVNVPAHRLQNPFTTEKDVKDNHVAIIEFRNGVKATFQLTLANAIPDRRMYIACTEGTISLDNDLKYRTLGDPCITTLSYQSDGGHGGADSLMMQEFWDMLKNKKSPYPGALEGLECAVTCIYIDEAMNRRSVIELEPVWKTLGK